MTREEFMELKVGSVIRIQGQVRSVLAGPDGSAFPWNQVATTTEPWHDKWSGRLTTVMTDGDLHEAEVVST